MNTIDLLTTLRLVLSFAKDSPREDVLERLYDGVCQALEVQENTTRRSRASHPSR